MHLSLNLDISKFVVNFIFIIFKLDPELNQNNCTPLLLVGEKIKKYEVT